MRRALKSRGLEASNQPKGEKEGSKLSPQTPECVIGLEDQREVSWVWGCELWVGQRHGALAVCIIHRDALVGDLGQLQACTMKDPKLWMVAKASALWGWGDGKWE